MSRVDNFFIEMNMMLKLKFVMIAISSWIGINHQNSMRIRKITKREDFDEKIFICDDLEYAKYKYVYVIPIDQMNSDLHSKTMHEKKIKLDVILKVIFNKACYGEYV